MFRMCAQCLTCIIALSVQDIWGRQGRRGHNGVWHQHAEAIHLSYIFVFLSNFALCFISYLKNALISVGIIPRFLNKEIYF